MWTFWKVFWALLFIVIVVGAITWSLGLLSQPAKILEKTFDADNIVQNYEWFKQTYQDIQATDIKIKNANAAVMSYVETLGPRDKWDMMDKTEYSRLNSVVLGLKNYREDLAARYNARSKMVNRAVFKHGDELPETISPLQ